MLAALACMVLYYVNAEPQKHSNRTLLNLLIVLALCLLNSVILDSHIPLTYPVLHKIFTPFVFLIAPISWLYIRSVLFGETSYRRHDWLVTIPTLLYYINLMPYYFAPTAVKRAHMVLVYKQLHLIARLDDGICPPFLISFLWLAWSGLFVVFGYRLIAKFQKNVPEQLYADNKNLADWLKVVNGLMAFLVVVTIIVSVRIALGTGTLIPFDITVGFCLGGICLQLFLRPELLYGVYQSATMAEAVKRDLLLNASPMYKGITIDDVIYNEDADKIIAQTFIKEDTYGCRKKIALILVTQKAFIKNNYSLQQLVIDVNIPRAVLSEFINREYGMGFRDYLNGHRVAYFKNNINNPQWMNLTLEGIASECGFGSRSTFIKSFKKHTGQTPKDYLKENNLYRFANELEA